MQVSSRRMQVVQARSREQIPSTGGLPQDRVAPCGSKALEESNPVASDAAESAESSTPPKMISLSDPASSWTAAPGGPAFFAYSTNYLIDLEAGIIMDVEATPANRSHEVESTKTMIDRVEQRLCLKPARLVGDTAYGTAAMLGLDGRAERDRTARPSLGKVRAQRRRILH